MKPFRPKLAAGATAVCHGSHHSTFYGNRLGSGDNIFQISIVLLSRTLSSNPT